MAAGHAFGLYLDRPSAVHRLPPEVKIVAMVAFTIAVVATPREAFWASGAYAVVVAVIAACARARPAWLLKRALIEVPFLVLAVALPFLGRGSRWSGSG